MIDFTPEIAVLAVLAQEVLGPFRPAKLCAPNMCNIAS